MQPAPYDVAFWVQFTGRAQSYAMLSYTMLRYIRLYA